MRPTHQLVHARTRVRSRYALMPLEGLLPFIAQRRYVSQTEWVALPVTGDCELIFAEMIPAGEADLPHVAGWLSHAGDVIEVLNLAALTPGPVAAIPLAPCEPQAHEVQS